MFHAAGEVLENFIGAECIRPDEELSQGSSTVDVVMEIIDVIRREDAYSRRPRPAVLFITLDARNASKSFR